MGSGERVAARPVGCSALLWPPPALLWGVEGPRAPAHLWMEGTVKVFAPGAQDPKDSSEGSTAVSGLPGQLSAQTSCPHCLLPVGLSEACGPATAQEWG